MSVLKDFTTSNNSFQKYRFTENIKSPSQSPWVVQSIGSMVMSLGPQRGERLKKNKVSKKLETSGLFLQEVNNGVVEAILELGQTSEKAPRTTGILYSHIPEAWVFAQLLFYFILYSIHGVPPFIRSRVRFGHYKQEFYTR